MALRYITLNDLVNEMPLELQGSLTDDTPNSQSKVDAILTSQGEAAEQEVESYLSQRYTLPLQAPDGTVPATVKKAIYIITKYFLYGRRDSMDEAVYAQYKTTAAWLRDVANGNANVNLILADGSFAAQGGQKILTSDFKESQFDSFI